jgi:hypothetical protein
MDVDTSVSGEDDSEMDEGEKQKPATKTFGKQLQNNNNFHKRPLQVKAFTRRRRTR